MTRTHRCTFSWLMLFALLWATALERVDAQEAFEVPIDVTISDGRTVKREVVTAKLQSDGTLAEVLAADLRDHVLSLSRPGTLASALEQEWLTVKVLIAAGLEVTYSAADLSAEVRIPPSLQPVQTISGRGARRTYSGAVAAPASVSAALPFYVNAQQVTRGATDDDPRETRNRLGVEVLPNVTYAGTVLAGRVNTQFGNDQGTLEAWEAAISRDLFGTTRVTAGTTRIDSFGFQTGQTVFGVGIEQRAGLGGTPVLADRFQASFEVETESSAEIYLNDRLIRAERLPPGRYSVSDLPLVPGLNDVRVVITDQLGQTTEIVDRVAHAAELLPVGDAEYGVAVGAIDGDVEIPLGSAYYRRGLAPGTTAVTYAEATVDDQLVGVHLTSSSPLGIVYVGGAGIHGAAAAASAYHYAVEGGYRFSAPSRRWIPSFGISLLHRSSGFYAPGALQDARPTRVAPLVAGLTLNQTLPLGFSLVAGGRYTVSGSGGADHATAFAYLGAQIARGVSLRAALNVDQIIERPEARGRISLAFGIGRGRYRSTAALPEEVVNMSTTQNFDIRAAGGSAGLSVDGVDMQTGEVGSAAGNVRLTHPRGEAAGAVRITPGEPVISDTVERSEARVRLGAGVYYADGVLGVGRPTTGSFAVIGADPALPADTILVNPRGEYAEARSGVLGGAVLSSVPDYYQKAIRVEIPGLPIDYALDWSDVVYQSEYRSGVGLRVGGGQLLYGSGRLVDGDGVPVALRVIRVMDAGETVYTGYTDEEGMFLIYDLTPGDYALRLGEAGSETRFSVPSDAVPPLDVGTLTIALDAGGK